MPKLCLQKKLSVNVKKKTCQMKKKMQINAKIFIFVKVHIFFQSVLPQGIFLVKPKQKQVIIGMRDSCVYIHILPFENVRDSQQHMIWCWIKKSWRPISSWRFLTRALKFTMFMRMNKHCSHASKDHMTEWQTNHLQQDKLK